MKQDDKLFRLIKSLSKSEKSILVALSTTTKLATAPMYMQLFALLEKQKVYDPEQLEKRLDPSIRKNLPSYRKRLFDKIVDSLIPQVAQTDKVDHLIACMPVLYQREQYTELLSRIRKAKKQALTCFRYADLIKMLDMQIQIARNDHEDSKQEETILRLLDERESYRKQLEGSCYYEDLRTRLELILKRDISLRNPDNNAKVHRLLDNDRLANQPENLNPIALEHYYYIMSAAAKLNQDYAQAIQYAEKQVQLFQDHKALQVQARAYKNALCNFLIVLLQDKSKLDRIPAVLKQMDQIPGTEGSPDLFKTRLYHELRYCMYTAKFDEAIKTIAVIEEHWPLICSCSLEKQQLAFCYNMLSVHLFKNNLTEVEVLLARVFTQYDVNEKNKNLIYATRILQLAVLYDLRPEQLDAQLASTSRLLRKQNHYWEFEKISLKHFRKLSNTQRTEHKSIVSELRSLLLQLQEQKPNSIVALSELILWCSSKLEGKTMEELFLSPKA